MQDPVRFIPSIGYLSTYIEPNEQPGLGKVEILNQLLDVYKHSECRLEWTLVMWKAVQS